MINRVKIFNFRSIEKAESKLALLVILYGPTASGKSSLFYSLIVLKNFITNSNQQSDGFFNLGFMNLGGFDNSVFNHEKEKPIEISFSIDDGEYGISLKKNSADIFLNSGIIKMKARVSIPYALNQNFTFIIKEQYNVNWNGISASVSPKQPTSETQEKAREISQALNKIPEYIKKVDIAPHKRGVFTCF
jgi:AAA15 family ATPase/GTPase